MRMPSRHTLLLLVALVLTGAAGFVGLRGESASFRRLTPALAAPATMVPATVVAATATPSVEPAVTPTTVTTPSASPTANAVSAATSKAIQAVIQQANQEQQDAFAKQDPKLMQDTATTGYYRQLVQINQDMANAGVSAIKLVKIEWGPVALRNATTARATTFETWQTTYADGTTEDSRDRNVYNLVSQGGSWKIQADQHPDDNLDQSPGSTVPGTVPGSSVPGSTVPPDTRPPSGRSGQSENWSGYAATGGNFTGVSGTWMVPQTQSNGSYASGATWIGIGGVTSRDLIQAGTEETTVGGSVRYNAWVEMLPSPSQPIRLSVRPGDSVSVSINDTGSDQWEIAFKDNTTGQTYQTTVQYASSHSSAEWIEEAPFARRQVLPLDNFGTITFSNGAAVEDGKTVTIAQAGAKPVTLVDGQGDVLASPSALVASGDGFSVTRSTVSSTSSGIPTFPDEPGENGEPGRRHRGFPTFPTVPGALPYSQTAF